MLEVTNHPQINQPCEENQSIHHNQNQEIKSDQRLISNLIVNQHDSNPIVNNPQVQHDCDPINDHPQINQPCDEDKLVNHNQDQEIKSEIDDHLIIVNIRTQYPSNRIGNNCLSKVCCSFFCCSPDPKEKALETSANLGNTVEL